MRNRIDVQCTGCTSCQQICPQQCIEMVFDKGFLYPVIDQSTCVNCGFCEKHCPENNELSRSNFKASMLAVKHKSDQVRLKSSSGGFFTEAYTHIINAGGSVYGATFTPNNKKIIHDRATDLDRCELFRGSKYVQSEKSNIFKKIKKDLDNNRIVLFSGTPCEVSGLNSFLGKTYENLYTCDVICHGVPSPQLWQDYVKFLESKMNSKLRKFSFRYKYSHWRLQHICAEFSNDKKTVSRLTNDGFGYLFLKNLILRNSCHTCRYSNLNRQSDITMGDFWKIGEATPEFDDKKGISQLIINSMKGKVLFEKIKEKFDYVETSFQNTLQQNLIAPTPTNASSNEFWLDYETKGISFVLNKYKPKYMRIKKILEKIHLLESIKNLKGKISI